MDEFKFSIDDNDLKIIKILVEVERNPQSITSTTLARKIFDIPNDYELRKKENFIRQRLNKLLSYGLVARPDKDYCLDMDKVELKDNVLTFKYNSVMTAILNLNSIKK